MRKNNYGGGDGGGGESEAGNRKLGATARIIANVDRSGVAAVPTAKMNNKISAFPAVLAVNQALMEGKISPISGARGKRKHTLANVVFPIMRLQDFLERAATVRQDVLIL